MYKILLPVDGSDHSRRAVGKATELSKLSGGEVSVFHFHELAPAKAGIGTPESSAESTALVDQAVSELQQAGVRASGQTRTGSFGGAAKAIVDEADQFGADLIVMGSRGLSDFEGLLVGSVAHKVVHHANCPVLIVR
jgi:nucleotide-binding universal stress UspA family protein